MPASVVKLSKDRRPPADRAAHGWVGLRGGPHPDTGQALLAMIASAGALLEETARLQREMANLVQALAAQGLQATIDEPRFYREALPAQPDRRETPPRRARGRGSAMVHPEPLTPREETVLRLLRSPLSLRQISRELYISHNTIKTHTRAIYRKLGVSTRHDAIERYRERATPTA